MVLKMMHSVLCMLNCYVCTSIEGLGTRKCIKRSTYEKTIIKKQTQKKLSYRVVLLASGASLPRRLNAGIFYSFIWAYVTSTVHSVIFNVILNTAEKLNAIPNTCVHVTAPVPRQNRVALVLVHQYTAKEHNITHFVGGHQLLAVLVLLDALWAALQPPLSQPTRLSRKPRFRTDYTHPSKTSPFLSLSFLTPRTVHGCSFPLK